METRWHWTQTKRQDGGDISAVDIDVGGCFCYFALAVQEDGYGDPVDPSYWAGPPDDLWRFASEEDARARAYAFRGTATWTFPKGVRCRILRFWHRALDDKPYTLRELQFR